MTGLTAPDKPKYFAFLSYAHKDARTAAALSRYIETFRVPVKLGGKEQQLPKRMMPIFRDRDEFSASSDLGTAIQDALAKSGALIVLCSSDAARSRWVNEEIRTFQRVSESRRIFPVLLEGEPSEAFPLALTEKGSEPLAVDLRPHKENLRDGRLRLVAALLGVDFDALKQRELRRVRTAQLRTGLIAAVIAVLVAFPVGLVIHNAIQPKFTEYLISTLHHPEGVTAGLDGALWFTASAGISGSGWIGRAALQGRNVTITEYPTPTRDSAPKGIAVGPDGSLWFTEFNADKISRVVLRKGRIAVIEYPTPTVNSHPMGITVGPDRAMWFTEAAAGQIGRATFRNGRVTITEYAVPTAFRHPYNITTGPDGALWFTESAGSSYNNTGWIGRAALRYGRVTITEYPTPTRDSSPEGIVVGPDGALWFTENDASRIGRVAFRDGRVTMTEYPTPTVNSYPGGITVGPDGALWFTELSGLSSLGAIGRAVFRDGRVTISEYPTPTANSAPEGITAGPDGALWFTEEYGDQIGRATTGFRLSK